MSGSLALLQAEAQADAIYGFPSGTMAALGQTESSQGLNLGTIGNIFQVKPSTAANPGYGLGPLDGNDPISAGGYLSALTQGPAGGNLALGLAMYHGGAGNPTPYAPSSAIGRFLAALSGGAGTAIVQDPVARAAPAQQLTDAQYQQASQQSTSCGLMDVGCYVRAVGGSVQPYLIPALFVVLGLLFVAGSLFLFGIRTEVRGAVHALE